MKKIGLTDSWLFVVFSVLAVLCALPGCSSRLISSDPPVKGQEAAAAAEVEVTVARITDGDTVRVSPEIGGEDRVRLIGVDTPETIPGRRPDPYGEERPPVSRGRGSKAVM